MIKLFLFCLCYQPTATSARKHKIDQALVKIIVKDMTPPSIVEDDGFIEFIGVLDPRYVHTHTIKLTLHYNRIF